MKIAIIPARGGSKRIPRKNLKSFCGRPIIGYTISAALESGVFDRIIVTTDDKEIANVARGLGAEVPFVRPAELSNDNATTVPVIAHAIAWASENWSPVEYACCIYATAPFVSANDIREAYQRLVDDRVTGYVFSATSFPFPIQRAFRITSSGHCSMFQPQHYNTRSQDLEEAFQDAGQFYWGSAQSYLSAKFFFSDDSKPFIIPRYRVQDIDTLQDWTRAEIMWRVLQESQVTQTSVKVNQ